MRAIINLALLAAIAVTLASFSDAASALQSSEGGSEGSSLKSHINQASASELGSNNHHREKRAVHKIPKKKAKKAIKKAKKDKKKPDLLPPYIDPKIGMSTGMFQSMPITQSFAGPFSVLGGLLILASFAMAASYFSTVNANQRLGYDYAGPYIQRRSSYDINPEPILSYINSFR